MYEESIHDLREKAEFLRKANHYSSIQNSFAETMSKAADIIEEEDMAFRHLERDYKELCAHLPKWVPVTEQLPKTRESILGKKSSKVIVAFRFDDGTQGTGTAHTLNGEWVFEDHIIVVARTITHWMPLPEPPKEEI